MKRILLLLFFIPFIFFGQSKNILNGFKYAVLTEDSYLLKNKLNEIGIPSFYINERLPEDLISNKCLAIYIGFKEYRGGSGTIPAYFTSIIFKDCQLRTIFETSERHQTNYRGSESKSIKKLSKKLNYTFNSDLIISSKEKFELNKPNKPNINKWAGNGSGVIISKSGHIITNHHVIEDAEKIEVEFMLDGELQKFNAEVVQVDKTNDLAVLKIFDMNFDGVSEPPYNFKFRGSDVGTKVYAFGYPMALSIMGKEIKVTDGMISSKSGFDGNITTYQITAPIQGGNSGGPLFDEQANLIGINSSGIRKDIADNVAYSIKTSYVSNLLDVLPKSIELPSSTRLKSLPLTEQIKEISKYVVLIKVK